MWKKPSVSKILGGEVVTLRSQARAVGESPCYLVRPMLSAPATAFTACLALTIKTIILNFRARNNWLYIHFSFHLIAVITNWMNKYDGKQLLI